MSKIISEKINNLNDENNIYKIKIISHLMIVKIKLIILKIICQMIIKYVQNTQVVKVENSEN